MGKSERRAYVQAVGARYRASSRVDKATIVDEMTATLGCHRKAVIRMLGNRGSKCSAATQGSRCKTGRRSSVTASDLVVLTRLVRACDYPCGKRLVAMLPLWIDYDEAEHGDYETGQKARILSLSAATLDRHLRPVRQQAGMRGKTGTKPGSLLREHIPIRSGPWEVTGPGFIEADTVAHCGHSLAGQFAWSLTMTDIHTTWTECRAVWHKQALSVRNAVQEIGDAMPFTIRGFDCDNGSEFLNHTLTRYFQEHPDKPTFTRSRPYRKNDNAHVEQKNWTHVRQLWGYQRVEQKPLVDAMNELYRKEVSWLVNLFTPSMKLLRKDRVGAKIVKRYGPPQTPLQRLLDCPGFDAEKARYTQLAKTLNPLTLRTHIRDKVREILAASSVTQLLRQ